MITDVPQLAVGQLLNKQHPLAKGMRGFWVAGAGPRGLTWHDLTDSHNDGALVDGPTWSAASHPGGFGSLECSAGDYVDAGGPSSLKPAGGLTLAFWCNLASLHKFSIGWNDSFNTGYFVGSENNKWFFYLDGVDNWLLGADTGIGIGTWHHLAHTYDGSWMTLYVDGVFRANNNQTGTIGYAGATTLKLGYTSAAYNNVGKFTDYMIADRGFSAAEVRALFDEGRQGYPNLINRDRRRVYAAAVAVPAAGNPWYYYAQQEAAA